MKKILFFIIVAILQFSNIVNAQPKLGLSADLFADSIGAKAFILIDADSKRILSNYRSIEHLDVASITKLMTAYTVYKELEKGNLDINDITVISENARNMTEGSRMFLEYGSRVSIDDLLNGLIIQSGNDAAIALAEAVAGSEEEFVILMNKYSKSLGLHNSRFKNVIGFTEDGHYMSAKDVAMLARAIITEYPEHYKLYKKKSFTWNNIKQNNRNYLLNIDPSIDGLKTGYTKAAGYCLAASAKRDGMRLISVVIGNNSIKERVIASQKILDFGFNNFVTKTLVEANKKLITAKVENGVLAGVDIAATKLIRLPISRYEQKYLKTQLVLDKPLRAPILSGQLVGNINIKVKDNIIASTPAIAMITIDEIGFFAKLWRKLFN